MLIVMEKTATPDQIKAVEAAVTARGYEARPIPGGERISIGVLRNKGAVDASLFLGLGGVKDVIPVTRPYKLVSRETRSEDTVVRVGDVAIGNGNMTIIAGPCAIESEAQALTIARHVKDAGAHMFRGGAFKPRTSPYSFQGLGQEGLEILAKVRHETGLPVVTEVMDMATFDQVESYADMIQIGTRNMQNFSLLRRAGRSPRPVILKRGMAATIDEWLWSAEYVLAEGNDKIVMCERGIRTFENSTQNTLDISAVPVVQARSHLPVIVDVTHSGGRRDLLVPLTKAGLATGADGIMIEVHPNPKEALVDGAQSLTPEDFADLMQSLKPIAAAVGRSV